MSNIYVDKPIHKAQSFFACAIGLSIFGYLNPLHSPIGHDFLPNVVSFIVISLGVGMALLYRQPTVSLKQYSLSIYSWLALAVLLCIQPFLNPIRYVDALIFPIGSLILVTLVSVTASNLLTTAEQKRQFIHEISGWLYATLVLTFVIQVMQATNHTITMNGWGLTRATALPDRLDGNFGQVNHTAYAFLFGICCVMYQLHTLTQTARTRIYQLVLVLLLAIFAVGISLTKSRAVMLMLVVAIGVYFFSQSHRVGVKKPLAWAMGILGVFAVSYMLGGAVMAGLSPDKVDATGGVGRLVSSGMDNQRISLNHKAILIFQDSPLTGVGWRNYAVGGIPHVDELKSVTFSDNSHMIFTQIASELGILGLLCLVPVLWLVARSLHTRHSPESAMALAFVVATCIYACFEYPLWYFRYLAVFGLFLALIEQKNRVLTVENSQLPKVLGVVALVFTLISGYYLYQFWTNKYLFWYTHDNLVTDATSGKKVLKNPSVFGFLNYNDMDLASVVDISVEDLPQKLALFDRVLVDESSSYNLIAYGQLLSLDGQYDKALETFKTACRMEENKEHCDGIETTLRESATVYPQHFQANAEAYQAWLKSKNL